MTDKHSDKDKEANKEGGNTSSNDSPDPTRRRFLKNTGMVAGGVVGGSLLGGFLTDQFTTTEEPKTGSEKENKPAKYEQARQFFHRKEDFNVLEAATERIFPKDDNGPGAIELGVPYFID